MGHACRCSFGSLFLAAEDILIAQHVHAVGVYSMYLDIFVKMRCTFSFALYHNGVQILLSSMYMLCIFQSSSVCVVVVMVVVVVVLL